MTDMTELACSCGQVRLVVRGDPIISTECHCNSCRAAAERLVSAGAAQTMLEPNGGTHFVCYRKDRIEVTAGTGLLRQFRLSDGASTRRVVASCCNTPVFLEFEHGHWLSLYSHIWPDGALPRLDMRTMTGNRADKGAALSPDIPAGKLPTARFYGRLLGAWMAMGFRSPKIGYVEGRIEA